ncbi:UNVERIFIED_CONTAM: hypothetical protein FKN15_054739 [Acipenser sinensis]
MESPVDVSRLEQEVVEELGVSMEELRVWIDEEVEKCDFFKQRKAQLSELESWVQQKEAEVESVDKLFVDASQSVVDCEALVKELYSKLSLSYRESSSEDEDAASKGGKEGEVIEIEDEDEDDDEDQVVVDVESVVPATKPATPTTKDPAMFKDAMAAMKKSAQEVQKFVDAVSKSSPEPPSTSLLNRGPPAPPSLSSQPPQQAGGVAVKEGELVLYMRILGKKRTKTWHKGTLIAINPTGSGSFKYKVKFDNKGKSLLSGNHVAFDYHPALDKLHVGARVVAKYKDGNQVWLYAGVVAEMPNSKNKMRFLIFFDDGYASYSSFEPNGPVLLLLLLLQHSSSLLLLFPRFLIFFDDGYASYDDKRCEWIYRGSTRLEPMFNLKMNTANFQEKKQAGLQRTRPNMGL